MRAPTLPGLEFEGAFYAFDRLPKIRRKLKRRSSRLLYDELMAHYVAPGWPLTAGNHELGKALDWSEGHVQREVGILAATKIPGTDIPFIKVVISGPKRRIYLNTPPMEKGRASAPLGGQKGRASAPLETADSEPQTVAVQETTPEGPTIPFEKSLNETSNVDVAPIPEKHLAHACASEGAGPVEGTTLPAPSAEALRERIAELELAIARLKASGSPAAVMNERLALSAALLGARAELATLEASDRPAATPSARKVGSPWPTPVGPPAAKPAAPAPYVETPDLIRRLISPSGPDQVEAIVARLCEKLDPEFEPLYRRCCADVLAGRLDVGAMIGGFRWARNAPGFGKKKGPSFAAYIGQSRESRATSRPAPHRRE